MFDYTKNHNNMMASNELFKLNYYDMQGWNLQTDSTTTDTPLRYFSASDKRIRNSTYSPSSSLQQVYSMPSIVKSENIIEFDKQQQR
jgi:hypothetical protein